MEFHALARAGRLNAAHIGSEDERIVFPVHARLVRDRVVVERKCLRKTFKPGIFSKIEELLQAPCLGNGIALPHSNIDLHGVIHALALFKNLEPGAIHGDQVLRGHPQKLNELFLGQVLDRILQAGHCFVLSIR